MPPEKEKELNPSKGKIAAVLVRGLADLRTPIKDTLKMLHLSHKNHCVVLEHNPINLGMLKKVKDYITWGELSEETFKELVEKRGKLYTGPETCSKGKIKYNKFFIYHNKKYQKYFRLNPPQKGFGRKGIKISFKAKGALGYRREKINDLIKRML